MSGQNYVNHIAFVLDASGSMYRHKAALIKVADDQIAHLARRSKELNQETRVSIFAFASQARCLIWDMDVLRLPSIASLYNTGGNTVLIDATLLSQRDLAMTPEKYGDHSFLTFVLTDGEENSSRENPYILTNLISNQPSHWTMAALVPNILAKREAQRFGFPKENIAVWDTDSDTGMEDAGTIIRAATDSYMQARTTGVRGTRSLFSTGADAVNAQTVAQMGLLPLPDSAYKLIVVPPGQNETQIRDFIKSCGYTYVLGNAYYQLKRRTKIQANKLVAVVERSTSKVYLGKQARDLIGLPDRETTVRPNHNPKFDIYVQSTSVNRKLFTGDHVMWLH